MATYRSKVEIELLCDTTGAVIKYTTDGSEPSATNGEIYNDRLTLYKNAIVKVLAIKEGLENSNIATEDIKIKLVNLSTYLEKTIAETGDKATIKLIEPLSNKYGNSCKYRYSLDTVPNESTPDIIAEGGVITINKNCYVYSIITADNNISSDILLFSIDTLKVQTPVITVS